MKLCLEEFQKMIKNLTIFDFKMNLHLSVSFAFFYS